MTTRKILLEKLILRQIEEQGGCLPFSKFMFLALNAPGLGYYASENRIFGCSGDDGSDFITGPEMTPFFSRILARPIAQILGELAVPHILEFGAGTGLLVVNLLEELESLGFPCVRYTIIESSENLIRRQCATINRYMPHKLKNIFWQRSLPSSFCGVILLNEVMDTLPVQLIVNHEGSWYERGVGVNPNFQSSGDDFLTESAFCWQDMTQPIDIKRIPGIFPGTLDLLGNIDGYLTEVHPQACVLMGKIAQTLSKGAAFIIDYGFPAHEYYHPDRSSGTLVCHYRHRVHGDPLVLVGKQDITAHVNFTAMAAVVGKSATWLGYASQGRFLIESGLTALFNTLDCSAKEYSMWAADINRLISPAEMGELFKVFVCGKDVSELDAFVRYNRIGALNEL